MCVCFIEIQTLSTKTAFRCFGPIPITKNPRKKDFQGRVGSLFYFLLSLVSKTRNNAQNIIFTTAIFALSAKKGIFQEKF